MKWKKRIYNFKKSILNIYLGLFYFDNSKSRARNCIQMSLESSQPSHPHSETWWRQSRAVGRLFSESVVRREELMGKWMEFCAAENY